MMLTCVWVMNISVVRDLYQQQHSWLLLILSADFLLKSVVLILMLPRVHLIMVWMI